MAIRQLPNELVNKIAAGEVVERPASVIKELIENSLDANAKNIVITSKRGGKSLMQVKDDGEGMNESDIKLSVARHATSKLNQDNLENITSLGFRGEALASIGSIAKLTISSRAKNSDAGAQIIVEQSRLSPLMPCSMNRGTIVRVENLFENVPARLKFLKSDRAEANAINDIIKRLAMANPHVHFIVEGGERAGINWPSQKGDDALRARLGQIMGAQFIENSFEIDFTIDNIRVFGFGGLPTYTKANSLSQFFFVNNRFVRDKLLFAATRVAYSDYLFRDRFPIIALFVDISPFEVDVNVHPAKTEVRFRDNNSVRSAIIRAIKDGLNKAGYKSANIIGEKTISSFRPPAEFSGEKNYFASSPENYKPMSSPRFQSLPQQTTPNISGLNELSAQFDNAKAQEIEEAKEQDYPLGVARVQIFENYIISQSQEAIFLIDQHAAHERLVYEKFKRQLNEGFVPSQAQLIPIIVELPLEDCENLAQNAKIFEKLGLYLEQFGEKAIAVREVPALLGNRVDIELLVKDLADGLAQWEKSEALSDNLEAVIARMACHGSVRSGRILKQEEMNALLREMENTPHSGQCIHGRPTYVELKKNDIERLFGR